MSLCKLRCQDPILMTDFSGSAHLILRPCNPPNTFIETITWFVKLGMYIILISERWVFNELLTLCEFLISGQSIIISL